MPPPSPPSPPPPSFPPAPPLPSPSPSTSTSTSTSPPPSTSPLLASPPSGSRHLLQVSLLLSGEVSDYTTEDTSRRVLEAFASAAGLPSVPLGATITFTPASVLLQASFPVASAAVASSAAATLGAAMGSAAAATSVLAAAGVPGLAVISAPTITGSTLEVAVSPPSPPALGVPASGQSANTSADGGTMVAVMAAGIGAVLAIGACLSCAYRRRWRRQQAHSTVQCKGASTTATTTASTTATVPAATATATCGLMPSSTTATASLETVQPLAGIETKRKQSSLGDCLEPQRATEDAPLPLDQPPPPPSRCISHVTKDDGSVKLGERMSQFMRPAPLMSHSMGKAATGTLPNRRSHLEVTGASGDDDNDRSVSGATSRPDTSADGIGSEVTKASLRTRRGSIEKSGLAGGASTSRAAAGPQTSRSNKDAPPSTRRGSIPQTTSVTPVRRGSTPPSTRRGSVSPSTRQGSVQPGLSSSLVSERGRTRAMSTMPASCMPFPISDLSATDATSTPSLVAVADDLELELEPELEHKVELEPELEPELDGIPSGDAVPADSALSAALSRDSIRKAFEAEAAQSPRLSPRSSLRPSPRSSRRVRI